MKKIDAMRFECGELYLFALTPDERPERCLWGVFDRKESGSILLEQMTRSLRWFVLGVPLPSAYRYARLASREELRDYFFMLGSDEAVAH